MPHSTGNLPVRMPKLAIWTGRFETGDKSRPRHHAGTISIRPPYASQHREPPGPNDQVGHSGGQTCGGMLSRDPLCPLQCGTRTPTTGGGGNRNSDIGSPAKGSDRLCGRTEGPQPPAEGERSWPGQKQRRRANGLLRGLVDSQGVSRREGRRNRARSVGKCARRCSCWWEYCGH